jgi:uncharacterized protein with ACT and thioredoxin-like domain
MHIIVINTIPIEGRNQFRVVSNVVAKFYRTEVLELEGAVAVPTHSL